MYNRYGDLVFLKDNVLCNNYYTILLLAPWQIGKETRSHAHWWAVTAELFLVVLFNITVVFNSIYTQHESISQMTDWQIVRGEFTSKTGLSELYGIDFQYVATELVVLISRTFSNKSKDYESVRQISMEYIIISLVIWK